MSEPRFTPGPWRNWMMGSEGCRILPETGNKREDLKYIAIVNGKDLPTDKANADLIAAAPDLYRALKWARTCFRDNCDLANEIDVAIAKAEGRSC